MLQKDLPLSEPEGEYSDCSSYEELSSNSEQETEEVILYEKENKESKSSSSNESSASYRSWYSSSKRRCSKASNNLSVKSSKDSLTVINESHKNWWYWMKLAIFISTPFIARQLGIMVGKRILGKAFKTA